MHSCFQIVGDPGPRHLSSSRVRRQEQQGQVRALQGLCVDMAAEGKVNHSEWYNHIYGDFIWSRG